MKSPIRKLLFLNNQSSSGSLIYFALLLKKELYANIARRNKMQGSMHYPDFDLYWLSWFSVFIFKVNWVFMEGKVDIDEEELDGIEIYGILNLENLPRTVFIG